MKSSDVPYFFDTISKTKQLMSELTAQGRYQEIDQLEKIFEQIENAETVAVKLHYIQCLENRAQIAREAKLDSTLAVVQDRQENDEPPVPEVVLQCIERIKTKAEAHAELAKAKCVEEMLDQQIYALCDRIEQITAGKSDNDSFVIEQCGILEAQYYIFIKDTNTHILNASLDDAGFINIAGITAPENQGGEQKPVVAARRDENSLSPSMSRRR